MRALIGALALGAALCCAGPAWATGGSWTHGTGGSGSTGGGSNAGTATGSATAEAGTEPGAADTFDTAIPADVSLLEECGCAWGADPVGGTVGAVVLLSLVAARRRS